MLVYGARYPLGPGFHHEIDDLVSGLSNKSVAHFTCEGTAYLGRKGGGHRPDNRNPLDSETRGVAMVRRIVQFIHFGYLLSEGKQDPNRHGLAGLLGHEP